MIDNLLKYPTSCIVGKTIPKNAFFRFLDVNAAMKRHFQDDVASITWLYKIAPTTLQVQSTDTMREIEIFLAELKQPDCTTDLFRFIDKNMPQHIVFILQHGDEWQFLINYKEWADVEHTRFNITETFLSEKRKCEQLSLTIQGNELPAIYEGFVRQIAGARLKGDTDTLKGDVLSFQEQEIIEKRLAKLQLLIHKETQPQRKFELHQEILTLQKKLNAQ